MGVGHLSADFRWKWVSPTHYCWCHISRVTALLCGIKISAVHQLVLSRSTHVTDGSKDGQNYDSQDHLCICSRSKNGGVKTLPWYHIKQTYQTYNQQNTEQLDNNTSNVNCSMIIARATATYCSMMAEVVSPSDCNETRTSLRRM